MREKGAIRIALTAIAFVLASPIGRAQDVTIVVNRSVSLSEITESELRDIFIGARSRFADGSRAVPVFLKGGPAHEVFLHRHVGDTPDEFRIRWRKAVFTGQGSMPREFTTEAALLHYVESTSGAIGYVCRKPERDTLKVLAISGAQLGAH